MEAYLLVGSIAALIGLGGGWYLKGKYGAKAEAVELAVKK